MSSQSIVSADTAIKHDAVFDRDSLDFFSFVQDNIKDNKEKYPVLTLDNSQNTL